MSTPLMALPSTGPLRQYELTKHDCQMSSISRGFLPIRNGLRYLSTAVSTVRGPLGEGGAAEPVQPRFAGQHLDDDQPDIRRRRQDRLDVGDLQGRHADALDAQAGDFLRGFLARFGGAETGSEEGKRGRGGQAA
jgi:hypothetical protein